MGTQIADLPQEVIERIKQCRYDRIIEKHEGPETWAFILDYTDFLTFDERDVLLPVDKEYHPNISLLRLIVGEDRQTLTLFLKDMTFTQSPDDEMFDAGRVAICEKMPGQDFYLATVYHEWYIVESPS